MYPIQDFSCESSCTPSQVSSAVELDSRVSEAASASLDTSSAQKRPHGSIISSYDLSTKDINERLKYHRQRLRLEKRELEAPTRGALLSRVQQMPIDVKLPRVVVARDSESESNVTTLEVGTLTTSVEESFIPNDPELPVFRKFSRDEDTETPSALDVDLSLSEEAQSILEPNKRKRSSRIYTPEQKAARAVKRKEYRDAHREAYDTYRRQYREKNKDAISAKEKEYRLRNKDVLAERYKKFRLRNKDALAIKHKAYREKNKEALAIWRREYNEKHNAPKRVKINNDEPSVTADTNASFRLIDLSDSDLLSLIEYCDACDLQSDEIATQSTHVHSSQKQPHDSDLLDLMEFIDTFDPPNNTSSNFEKNKQAEEEKE